MSVLASVFPAFNNGLVELYVPAMRLREHAPR
jgi:hypothetical protein